MGYAVQRKTSVEKREKESWGGAGTFLELGTSSQGFWSRLIFVRLKVLDKHGSDLVECVCEFLGRALPDLAGVEQFVRHVGDLGGHLEVKDLVVRVLGVGQFAAVDGVENGTGVLERATLGDARLATDPAGVDQPGIGLVLGHLFGQHGRVALGMEHEEWRAKAGGEGGLGLGNAIFGAGDLGRVARDEVVHGLLGCELGDRRKDAKGVAGQEDDVLGMAAHARNLGIRNVV